jgi:hypothetical protein
MIAGGIIVVVAIVASLITLSRPADSDSSTIPLASPAAAGDIDAAVPGDVDAMAPGEGARANAAEALGAPAATEGGDVSSTDQGVQITREAFEALGDNLLEDISRYFEALGDNLLEDISRYYGLAVALDQGRAACSELQAAYVAVEDDWIAYIVQGRALWTGRLPEDLTQRDERLYAGVQDVEREFSRSGCARP